MLGRAPEVREDRPIEPPVRRLSRLEVLTGVVLGLDEGVPVPAPDHRIPVEAWEHLLVPLLEAGSCFVAFSGGRDSTAILAVATRVARARGLEDPIPITLRFPGIAGAEESTYQEAVVAHLALRRWERVEPGESLDVFGEVATDLSRRFGALYPGNVHFVVPMAEHLRGGTLLIGIGGDEVMSGHAEYALAAALRGRRRPGRAALRALIERSTRRLNARARVLDEVLPHFPWLAPRVAAAFARGLVDDQREDPIFADRVLLRRTHRLGYLRRAMRDVQLVAASYGIRVTFPFLDPLFVARVAGRLGAAGYATRAETMASVFAGEYPAAWFEARPKAYFDGAFWTPLASRLARSIDVSPLAEFLDERALRAHWASALPKGNTYILAKHLRLTAF